MQGLLQFTLELFEPAAKKRSKSNEKADFLAPNRSPDSEIQAQKAIANTAPSDAVNEHLPAQTLQQALAPAAFTHPRASRETLINGVAVAYEFRRGKRRTIGFSVGADGLTVSTPKWLTLHEVDKAVLEKSGWIIKKLQEARERQERFESARVEWKDACTLPFLGEQMIVALDPCHVFSGAGAELTRSGVDVLPGVTQLTLHVGLPHTATPDQIKDAVQAWLMRQAKRIFTERLNHFAPALHVQWHKLGLSSAGTRWGSASADGSIRLNWRLIHFKQSVIDYVVVHELSHLRVMNHSPLFWETVCAVVPDYAALRGQLRDKGAPRW